MDKTLQALKARFRRLEWRAEADHHVGEDGRIVVAVWDDGGDLDGWRAFAAAGGLRVGTRSASAVEAVEKLAVEPDFKDALSGLPAEPEEWEAPNMPGPAALGCPALAAFFGLVGAFGAALWLGVEAVRWLTGGAS